MTDRITEVERLLQRVRDWVKFAANSDGGIVAEIDRMLALAPPTAEPSQFYVSGNYVIGGRADPNVQPEPAGGEAKAAPQESWMEYGETLADHQIKLPCLATPPNHEDGGSDLIGADGTRILYGHNPAITRQIAAALNVSAPPPAAVEGRPFNAPAFTGTQEDGTDVTEIGMDGTRYGVSTDKARQVFALQRIIREQAAEIAKREAAQNKIDRETCARLDEQAAEIERLRERLAGEKADLKEAQRSYVKAAGERNALEQKMKLFGEDVDKILQWKAERDALQQQLAEKTAECERLVRIMHDCARCGSKTGIEALLQQGQPTPAAPAAEPAGGEAKAVKSEATK